MMVDDLTADAGLCALLPDEAYAKRDLTLHALVQHNHQAPKRRIRKRRPWAKAARVAAQQASGTATQGQPDAD